MKCQTVDSKLDFALLNQQTLLVPSENLCTISLHVMYSAYNISLLNLLASCVAKNYIEPYIA